MKKIMATLIIDADYIKQYSPLEYSLDEGFVTPLIEDSQEFILQEVMGSSMYDDLLSEIDTEEGGGAAVSAKYTAIRNYMSNIVMHETLSRLVLESTFKLTNQGAVSKSGDNNTALSERGITRLKQKYRAKSDHWRGRLWKYLCENASTYPLWNSPPSGILMRPMKPRFRTAMT